MIRPVYLQAASGGFGEWDAVRGDEILDHISDAWDYDEAWELGLDEIPDGIEDIRGLIHVEPDHVYYILSHQWGGGYIGADDVGDNHTGDGVRR